jgi:hypothetical protein
MYPVPNPLSIAARGKGIIPMLARGVTIANRYGFTPAKIHNAMSQLSNTLKQYQCQATLPVTALALSRNMEIARKFQTQGIELAVHGLSHIDHRQLPAEIQLDHIHQAQHIFKHAGITATGFRSPYLRWNMDTLTALKACGFVYDSSQAIDMRVTSGLETSSYYRALEFYQAQATSQYLALPRQDAGLVRIPYCLPDDEALVDRLHLSSPVAMAEIWLEMLSCIYQAGELLTLGLHPERIHLCQAALEAVLEKAITLSPHVWIARLDEIAAWYLALGKTTFEIHQESGDLYHVKINAPARASILVRSLGVITATQPWVQGYHSVLTNNFNFRSNKRPLVGVSPDAPVSLERFLRHQGYLVEISPESQAYTYYINRSSFNPEDERRLLTELEQGDWPVVRLSRWPDAAHCGLTITGDVDAFTIWDYGRRILAN